MTMFIRLLLHDLFGFYVIPHLRRVIYIYIYLSLEKNRKKNHHDSAISVNYESYSLLQRSICRRLFLNYHQSKMNYNKERQFVLTFHQ